MGLILHLAEAQYYAGLPRAAPYLPRGFERDGFVHCTQTGDRLLRVANALYRDVPGAFVALIIDDNRLDAPVRYEPPTSNAAGDAADSSSELFPHVYGPINRDAIVGIAHARRDPSGAFTGFDRDI